MSKLVVLKLDGELERGLQVSLEIGEDDKRPSTEVRGKLPKSLELSEVYSRWQTQYRSQQKGFRKLSAKFRQITHLSRKDFSPELREKINKWLNSKKFRSVKDKLLQKLDESEEIRVLIQTEDPQLQQIPWHLWDFFKEYPKAELALSAPEYEQVAQNVSRKKTKDLVKILAILGNSEGIDVEQDRQILDNLKNAEVTFLPEPSRKDLNDKLWEQNWDILFFAGHSQTEGEKGRIFINSTESLNLEELTFALRKAIENGLQLAIFNSCEGLGLARELSELYIPQVIVMREPVPDRVAQEFLKYFLSIFSNGTSLYVSVREAREHLQSLDEEFPGATFLPVIFQNPAVLPPTWAQLCNRPDCLTPPWFFKKLLSAIARVGRRDSFIPLHSTKIGSKEDLVVYNKHAEKERQARERTISEQEVPVRSQSPTVTNNHILESKAKSDREKKQRNDRKELDLYNSFKGNVLVEEKITPKEGGWVRFRGSLWRAQPYSSTIFHAGDEVSIIDRNSLTLIVDRIDIAPSKNSP